jgi:hypothetical protein
MTQDSPQLQAFRWIADQIVNESLKTRDFSLARSFVRDTDLNGVERQAILCNLFWESLRSSAWELASDCLLEGYPIIPKECADRGPLHDSFYHLGNRPDAIQWLLDKGAEVERRGPSNITPLIAAIQMNYEEVIGLLLRHGANVNASSVIDEDLTPLMAAARAGNEALVGLLLSHGADPNVRDRFGRNAAQYAEAAGHSDLARSIFAEGVTTSGPNPKSNKPPSRSS